jgi:hypothetical protein
MIESENSGLAGLVILSNKSKSEILLYMEYGCFIKSHVCVLRGVSMGLVGSGLGASITRPD